MTLTQRFDIQAATWDENPRRVSLAKGVAEAIALQVPLAETMAVLDYGCGTGLLSLFLRPLVGPLTGADTSPGMLEVFRRKVAELGLADTTAHLLEPGRALPGTYDLITSSMTLHHVEHLAPLFRSFREHLWPGGRVALADLDTEDGSFHEENPGDVFHLGFERAAVMGLLAEAGFGELEATTAFEVRRNGRHYPVFLITGRVD